MANLLTAVSGDDTGATKILIAHINNIINLLNGTTAGKIKLIGNDDQQILLQPGSAPADLTTAILELLSAAGTSLLALRYNGVIESNVADGTAPMVVTSTTKVANLNADKVDGIDTPASPTGDLVTTTNTQTLTNKTLTTPTIADLTNAAHDHGDADDGGAIVAAALGLTTEGDTLYRNATVLARLAAGAGLALKRMNAGATAPEWAAPAAALGLTTEGDTLYRDATGLARLAKGTAGQVKRMNAGATAPEWGQVARVLRKASAQTVSGTTYTSDTDLTFTGLANAVYAVFFHLWATGDAADDNKIKILVPGTSTVRWSAQYFNASAAWTPSGAQLDESNEIVINGGATAGEVYIWALVTMDATGGVVALQYAKYADVTTATDMVMAAGSWMSISQV